MKIITVLPGHGHVELELRDRSTSRLLRFAPWSAGAWTTVNRVIYPPADQPVDDVAMRFTRFESILGHEAVHVRQQSSMTWVLFVLAYLLLPIPFLAPARAWLEAQAYAHEHVHYGRDLDKCVAAICSGLYFWPAPRWLVRRMLNRAVEGSRNAV